MRLIHDDLPEDARQSPAFNVPEFGRISVFRASVIRVTGILILMFFP